MARQVAAAVLLALAAACALLAGLGIARSRNNLAALHCSSIAGIAVPPLALVAVVVDTGVGVAFLKTLCLVAIVLLGAPIATHAIAVAEHRRHPR